jgi:DNA (cytosine-5)-methyltransferase 1
MKAVDLFSGWGGFTLAAQQAGSEVVFAANHWPVAVAVHSANHPSVKHACQDLRQFDWGSLPDYNLLLASPACQGHSTASQPKRNAHHDAMRATAWAVVDCADVTEPRALIVENVTSFRRWRLYETWTQALERIGYTLSTHVLTASAHGVPQRRERLFVVGLRNGRTLQMPLKFTSEPAFEPCLDDTADGWRPVAKAMPGARARIQSALARYPRCLVQHTTGHSGIPLTEPIRTITTKDQWVLADRRLGYRPLTTREIARGMGFPDSYTWPAELSRANVNRGLGNAVPPPMARDLITLVQEAA